MNDIRIRLYQLEDAPDLFEAARESVSEVYPWMNWRHPDYTLQESVDWISLQVQNQQNGTEFHFAILGGDGNYLGGCGLNEINEAKDTANLGYFVGSSAMGKGIAVKAVLLLSKWAFQHTELTRCEIKCAVGNVRSQRVAEKSGAAPEGIRPACIDVRGTKHDALVFSIQKTHTPPTSADEYADHVALTKQYRRQRHGIFQSPRNLLRQDRNAGRRFWRLSSLETRRRLDFRGSQSF